MIRFGPQTCGTIEEAALREWLVTDGLGGYAMGTVAGLRTRRYHGLLVVALGAPSNRMLGLAALDPVLVAGDAHYRVATDEWTGGVVDPRYGPYHRGNPAERDGAYHQGTVWPWLLGPYVDAARRSGVPSDDVLGGIEDHIHDWGVGSISETADGAAPHAASGCPFQAWSVAEVLRVRRPNA